MSPRRRRVRYGPRRQQVGELWLPGSPRPKARVVGPVPVVVLFHGGFWRAPYTKRLMHRLAADITRRGWAAWNVEYRRVGRFGGGGGWPATLLDAGGALDHVAALGDVDSSRVVVCGHSAGALLAFWSAGRRGLSAERSEPTPASSCAAICVRGAISLAGVLDLVSAAQMGVGGGAIPALLGGTPDQAPERYAAVSPVAMLPLGFEQIIVHGEQDAVVPPEHGERYAEASAEAGDPVVFQLVPGAGHLSMIDPERAAWRAAAAHFDRLLG